MTSSAPTKTWRFEGKDLPAVSAYQPQPTDVHELAAFILAQLDAVTQPDVQNLAESVSEIVRLPYLKEFYTPGTTHKTTKNFNSRPQHRQAMVAHLLVDKIASPGCKSCHSSRSQGPFKLCAYSSKGIFGGACTNCSYKGQGSNCTLYSKEEKTNDSKRKRSNGFLGMLTNAQLRELYAMVEAELQLRNDE